ncbi:creatininase family protein [Falsirhodobacter halotolerans]|uniref:creatininase family protein n=1 Tax=Falsirhodobacter halotolerans TaxID=1146892 RepID=UPI001FD25085|nr:creatininase family protein [Falsirhodobacter halotolerans]MCJ8138941.1 creatininase family protein [Falsirhodobacter halotolerans]
MTVAEFCDRLGDDPVILLPLGSHEEQGPHAPMGDYQLAEIIAGRIAESSGAVAAPCLPFGYADFFRGFPGGIQLRASTFTAVLADMITAFLDHGLERVLIVNGHSSNAPLIDQVLRRVRAERGVAVASLDLWRAIPDGVWGRVHGDDAARARGHGADPVTSVAMHLLPDAVRPDLIRPSGSATAFGLPAAVNGVRFGDVHVHLPLNAHEVNADGMLGGDATLASAAKGEEIVAHLTALGADLVRHLAHVDPRNPMDRVE